MALLNEINVKGVPHPIVTDDGYYQEMTVGDAEQLVATTFTEDDAPYNFRTAGGAIDIGDRKQVEGIVGGTVAWNQLMPIASSSMTKTSNGITCTDNRDGSYTLNGTATAVAYLTIAQNMQNSMTDGHKYLGIGATTNYVSFVDAWSNRFNLNYGDRVFAYNNTSGSRVDAAFYVPNGATINNVVLKPQFFDLTQMFGSTIADYIYSLEQAQVGTGMAWFRKYFPKPYYEYNTGEMMSVKALRHITRGFNAWDGTYESGKWIDSYITGEVTSSEAVYNVTDFIPVIPNTVYYHANTGSSRIIFYDADKNVIPMSRWVYANSEQNITSPANAHYIRFTITNAYKDAFCFNLSWDGERDGEYEEYSEHVYELDPDLELRGIPKLTAGNDLYYDGDVYEPDGTVTRKYGIVDMGTLNYAYYADNGIYRATGCPAKNMNILCPKYATGSAYVVWSAIADKTIQAGATDILIKDTTFGGDGGAFKTAMSGVYLVYELAEPTEETADPYNGTQIVDDFGTEEFIDAGVEAGTRDVAIPVGHNSLYQPNLRAKLEMVPEAPEDEGYYVVYHHDGINEYVPLIIPQELPELPSEDGTYTLKCTVASGSATLSFESEV